MAGFHWRASYILTGRFCLTASDAWEYVSSVHNDRGQPNDADRLRKYLARFGVSWQSIREK